jgi:ERCC4-type nuclease
MTATLARRLGAPTLRGRRGEAVAPSATIRLVPRAKALPVKIIVDVHERQSGIAETLAELGAEIEVSALPAGDYAVSADTLVERKRVLDLHTAVLKGRLWPQLGKLRAACVFPYLLVEGSDIDRGPLHHNAVRGVCLAVIDQGIALLRSGSQRDSALWIHRLAVRCQQVEPSADRPALPSGLGRGRASRRPRRSFPPCRASRRPARERCSPSSEAWPRS